VPLALVLGPAVIGCSLASGLGCDAPPPRSDPPPPRWVYPPGPAPLPLGERRGRLGRSLAPQLTLAAGITGDVRAPLRLPTPFPVPGGGPARAIVYGLEGAQTAIELVDIDAGRVVWRTKECTGPVVGVTGQATVCADASQIRGIGHDGARRWSVDATFLALTEGHVVVSSERPGEVLVLDAADGEELARVALPRGVGTDAVLASCGDAGRELFASGQDGRLVRIAEARGGPAIAWAVPAGGIAELDACSGDTVLVRLRGQPGALVAIARATGAITGRVDGVRGVWPARDGTDRLEIATAAGAARWPRTLAGEPEALALPPLGELIAERGDQRLVRATERTAVVLDRGGVRAYLPFAWLGGALGDGALLAATWSGSAGETVHRLGLPARSGRALRLPRRDAVVPPAELRELPAATDAAAAAWITRPAAALHAVADAALDPADPAALYAVTLERPASDAHGAGVARLDLAARAWRWQRGDGCGAGAPVGIAVAGDVVVCAARTASPPSATVTATGRDGAAGWQWEGDNVDGLVAAGAAVLVHDAGRLIVLDARTGLLRGRLASDDGAPLRVAAVAIGEATYAVTYERGRLVARLLAAGLLPVWSLAVDGVVRAIAPSVDGVLVELEDGDAYRIDVRTAAVTAMPGIGLAWAAPGDLVTGHAAGGPIPGPPPPAPTSAVAARRPSPGGAGAPARGPAAGDRPPPQWTPIPAGAPLGDSFQLTLFEQSGGLRARNDYPLLPPIEPAFARGPAGSPLVLAAGEGLREVLVLDPRDGAPRKRVQLPAEAGAARRLVFGTVVGGAPVAGVLLAAPLRAVLF